MTQFRETIRWKLIAVLFMFLVAISLILTIQQAYSQKKMLQEAFEEQQALMQETLIIQAKSHIELLGLQLENELAAYNFSNLVELVTLDARKNEKIDHTVVVDSRGKVIVHTADDTAVNTIMPVEEMNAGMIKTSEVSYQGHAMLKVSKTLYLGMQPWGELILYVPQTELEKRVALYSLELERKVNETLLGAFVAMMLFLLISFPFVYSMALRMIEPIMRLTKRARELSAGNFERAYDANLERHDELGILAKTFDEMRENLSRSYRRLEQYNTQLEEMVNERTVQLEEKNRELEKLSVTDPLTGLYNRGKLDHALHEQLLLGQRYTKPFSIILIDVDHFKRVNDEHGHQVGDEVLQEIAMTLKHSIRETDTIGRWGGEEFLILCPEMDGEHTMLLAEKLRNAVASHAYKSVEMQSISIGVSSFVPGDTEKSMLQRADMALYNAKKEGRNRACFGQL